MQIGKIPPFLPIERIIMTVSAQNLVWIDMEMTGLDPEENVVLEIATIVTDADLNILAEGPAGIRAYLDATGLTPLLKGGSWETAFNRTPGDSRITFENGSTIKLGSAEKADALRGGNFHGSIADELAFWDSAAWANLRFAVRLSLPDGTPARIVAATTPNGQNWQRTGTSA